MMRKKKKHQEEHADETWLLPYSDMLTLLLALFIVMFAMSEINKVKLQKVSSEFNIIFSGGSGVLEKDGNSVIPLEKSGSSAPTKNAIEYDKMDNARKLLEQEIENKGYGDKVKVILNKEGLEISIQDAVLFNSGDAAILDKEASLLLHISNMLKNLDNNIKIVGHTDNVPISSSNQKFRSNWDLSAMRAINIMSFMVNKGGMNPEKLSIQAYGEYKPKFDNSTESGRAKNRRVEIFVVSKYPLTTKAGN